VRPINTPTWVMERNPFYYVVDTDGNQLPYIDSVVMTLAENIEVHASHIGLGINPMALYALADRLAQPEGEWKHFEPKGARRWFYRTPKGND
jgi:hypothetical protein